MYGFKVRETLLVINNNILSNPSSKLFHIFFRLEDKTYLELHKNYCLSDDYNKKLVGPKWGDFFLKKKKNRTVNLRIKTIISLPGLFDDIRNTIENRHYRRKILTKDLPQSIQSRCILKKTRKRTSRIT